MTTQDTTTVNTKEGPIEATRTGAGAIIGTSPWGNWEAYLPLNGRTHYTYPHPSTDSQKSRIRKAVNQLLYS